MRHNPPISISLIYVYYNTPCELAVSIESVNRAVGKYKYEIIIVDNASAKKIPIEIFKKKIRMITNEVNVGFGAAVNQAAKIAKGEYLLIVNPDVLFHKDTIRKMIETLEQNKKIGIIGPKYLDGNGEVIPSVSGIPSFPGMIACFSLIDKFFPKNSFSKKYWMRDIDNSKLQKVPAIGGACLLVRKSVFDKIGGFDERFFMYFEEADLCQRIAKAGYSVVYLPQAVITHLVGRSSTDKALVQKRFEKSRFIYVQKYHGTISAFLSEGLIRLLSPTGLSLFFILCVSLFLNLYKITSLLMFFGDFGRDLLAARDMIVTGKIPLLGIPSSVIWLHQGPLSIYFIGLSLLIGRFNPIAPAVFYAFLGACSTFLVYRLGKALFGSRAGLLSAAFYATSPLIVMNARLPYHTAPIPFFTLLFFLTLWNVIKGNYRLIFTLFFLFGLLLELELSNALIAIILGIIWVFYRLPVTKRIILQALGGFVLGILPFILYDVTHHFIQTGGLFLWIINRIRLFLGLTISGNATTHEAGSAVTTIWSEIVRIIFPAVDIVVVAIIALGAIAVLQMRKELLYRAKPNGLIMSLVWLLVPITGYIVHAKPGTAYFPFLYPVIALFIGYTFFTYAKRFLLVLFVFFFIIFFNASYLVSNNYFLATQQSKTVPALYGYSYGISIGVQKEVAQFIAQDAKGNQLAIKGGGFLRQYATDVDNYKYLVWWYGAHLNDNAPVQYVIYQNKKEIPKHTQVVYNSTFVWVIKNVKHH